MSDAEQKAYEERLRNRLEVLKDELEFGQVSFPADSLLAKELPEVRVGPDGLVDLNTVGPAVRSFALAAEHIAARGEAKSVSLAWVQTEYFGLLEDILSDFLRAMKEHNATPQQIACSVEADEQMASQVIKSLEVVGPAFRSLWEKYQFVVDTHLQDMTHTKAVYGGDVFPQNHTNTIACASLMVDTIVVPDPIDRAANDLHMAMCESEVVYQLVKHGLSMLSFKEIVFADLPMPLLVASGGQLMKDGDFEQRWTKEAAAEDALFHLNSALQTDFESLPAVTEYLNRLEADEELDAKIPVPERLIPDVHFSGTLGERAQQLLKFRQERVTLDMPSSFGDIVTTDVFGRMLQANALLRRGLDFNGIPLIDAPTSWQWLHWKLEYDSARGKEVCARLDDVAHANALTSAFARESKYLA